MPVVAVALVTWICEDGNVSSNQLFDFTGHITFQQANKHLQEEHILLLLSLPVPLRKIRQHFQATSSSAAKYLRFRKLHATPPPPGWFCIRCPGAISSLRSAQSSCTLEEVFLINAKPIEELERSKLTPKASHTSDNGIHLSPSSAAKIQPRRRNRVTIVLSVHFAREGFEYAI